MAEQKSAVGAMELPVDWEALEDAFENNAPEVHSYLNLTTGDVLRLVDGVADAQMQSRVTTDRSYLVIEPVSSREQYRWMERFIGLVEEPALRDELAGAIDGRGAFRRFKDILMAHGPAREQWFAFRSERLKVFIEAWLAVHSVKAVPRKAKGAAHARPETGAAGHPVDGRRQRTAESYRRQLRDLLSAFGIKELEKVLAFAEFVRSQRPAKPGRGDEEAHGGPATDPLAFVVPPSEASGGGHD